MKPSNGKSFVIEEKSSIEDFIFSYTYHTTAQMAKMYGVARQTIDLYAMRLREKGYKVVSQRPKIDATTFVWAWNSSNNVGEVAEKIGQPLRSRRSLSSMAAQYRRKGHTLKEM